MIVRSLRWRLVIATALIIAAVVAGIGVFSSLTVKREFDRFLGAQRAYDKRRAEELLRKGGRANVLRAMQQIHSETQMRTAVFDDGGRLIAVWPPELREYRIEQAEGGALRLTRGVRGQGRTFEAMMLKGNALRVDGVGNVYFIPPPDERMAPRRAFRVSVDRWLIAGIALIALLGGVVMLTIFRRVFAPVEALTEGARALASGKLDARVDVAGRDEIGELAAAFNAMAEALERNERARRNMVNDVAHELRTPLTNIRVQIEAVQDGVLEPDAKLFASIEEDTAALSRLVDDLQQLSLAEAGQLRLEMETVSVDDLVERALDGLQRRVEERGLTVRRDLEPGLVARADARRIVQVLRNLIVNALTYARTTIAVCAERDGERIELHVVDDGPGVPAEHASNIFDRFYRADAARSRTTGGAGLGLAIARQLVELHGGTIRLQNQPGRGATFVFTIPSA